MALIPLNDALVKIMSSHISLGQIVALRAIICLTVIGLLSNGLSAVLKLGASVFFRFVGRGLCLVFAMLLFFAALSSLPLANVIAIFFVSPLIISLLSVPFLGETIGIHRFASVSIGMFGVVVIIKPTNADFQVESLLAFGAAICYAIFQIWTRRLKAQGSLSAMVTVQHLCYLFAGLFLLALTMIWPHENTGNASVDFLRRGPVKISLVDWFFLLICSGSVLLLSVASSNAYRSIEASIIAPFEYTAIPFGALWGILIWGSWPSGSDFMGMLLILFGGIYTLHRENIRQIDFATSTPMPASTAMGKLTCKPERKGQYKIK